MTADAGRGTFHINLMPECVIYKAHFPGHPVTPGVCIIQTATELLSELLGEELELQGVSNAKFLRVINPLENPSVTCTFSKVTACDADGVMKATCAFSDNGTIFSKLSLIYKKR